MSILSRHFTNYWLIIWWVFTWLLYISCSWHQATKPPILFSPILSTEFFSAWKVEKENYLFIDPKQVSLKILDQWKGFFLFQLVKLRKICGKNWEKQDWWFDVTKNIIDSTLYCKKPKHFLRFYMVKIYICFLQQKRTEKVVVVMCIK